MSNLLGMQSGSLLDINDPKPDQFTLQDIYVGLSREPRYGGQVATAAALSNRTYTVAQHSVLAAQKCREETGDLSACMAVLMHDAPEGLGLKDIPRPLKLLLPEYKIIEERLMDVIDEKFDIGYRFHEEVVKHYDDMMLWAELKTFRDYGDGPDLYDLFPDFKIWSTSGNMVRFFNTFMQLRSELDCAA